MKLLSLQRKWKLKNWRLQLITLFLLISVIWLACRATLLNPLDYEESQGEFVLLGDFNLPRGNEPYRDMAVEYKDNIPDTITSTLDPNLHYANKDKMVKLELVVDYLWSTPRYIVSKVRVVGGVSDHMAIVSNIEMA